MMPKACTLLLGMLVLQPHLARADELDCFGTSYAAVKGTAYKREISEDVALAHEKELYPPPAQDRIRSQNQPLDQIPPELARIQRGAVRTWVGMFINNGLAGYSGIDLDRKILIRVDRRTRRIKEGVSEDLGAPTFSAYDHTTFARKFSNEQFMQMEVVSTTRLDASLLTAFVCIANGIWKSSEKMEHQFPPKRTDTFSESSDLRDREKQGERWIAYNKPYDEYGPLKVVFDQVRGATVEWPWKR